MPSRHLLLAPLLLLAAACDTKATARASAGEPLLAVEKSKELESCAAARDCDTGLRCVDGRCQPATSSVLGDFYSEAALKRYQTHDYLEAERMVLAATNQYAKDGLTPRVELVCDWARVGGGSEKREVLERTARNLHRCLLGSPRGSARYNLALSQLDSLRPVGLDETLLARTELADAYLTLPPEGRAAPVAPLDPAITIQSSPDVTAKSFKLLIDDLITVKAPLTECVRVYRLSGGAATTASAQVGVKSRYVAELDDEPGRFVVATEKPKATGTELGLATCVRAVVDGELKKNLGIRDAFTTTLTFEFR